MEDRQPTPPPERDDLHARYAGNGQQDGQGAPPPPRDPDPAALFILLDALRLAAPAELQDRVTALMREALLTLRALIDHYLERLDDTPVERKVEDIPID
jgi:hypothetical protein